MRISLSKFRCDILISSEDMAGLKEFLAKNKQHISQGILITEESIFSLYGRPLETLFENQGIALHPLFIPEGEGAKSLETAKYCWEEMHKLGADRSCLVISLGGGTVSDLSGLVASLYMRGVDFISLPTTLLGMVDAAIGGKNGLNLAEGRNLIGSIYHPRLVLIAPHFLNTLSEREFSSGLAEIIKVAVIWDEEFFEYLEKYMPAILRKNKEKIKTIIGKACKIKAEMVRIDEKEKNLRHLLNYGHTFAHALEVATNFSRYTHGEAVAIGMSSAALVSKELGYVDVAFIERQTALCKAAGLSIEMPQDIDLQNLIHLMKKDKKASQGKLSLILPRKIGKVDKIEDIDPEKIQKALLFEDGGRG